MIYIIYQPICDCTIILWTWERMIRKTTLYHGGWVQFSIN